MSLESVKEAVIKGKRKDVKGIVPDLLESGIEAQAILDEALVPAMGEIGERFKRNEVYVPEMLVAARAMKEGMLIIEPKLIEAGITPEFKAVIATVEGDLHDIGKNLVAIMWKGAGFEVVDLGVNVTTPDLLSALKEHQPQLLGLSTLLTTTMPAMKSMVDAVKAEEFANLKVLVGGAPITQEYADEIGADGYSPDAASAVDVAQKLLAA